VKVTLKAESVVHGGETLARHDGRVVFLRGAAPGDRVEAELTGEGRFERTRALRVVERSTSHVDPPCPIVERCGGCPLQHVTYEAQLAAKEELTADALERIGGFPRGSYELVGGRGCIGRPAAPGDSRRPAPRPSSRSTNACCSSLCWKSWRRSRGERASCPVSSISVS